jgi:hypothetical protein
MVCDEVPVALAELCKALLSSADSVWVTIGFLEGTHEIFEGAKVYAVRAYYMYNLFEGGAL